MRTTLAAVMACLGFAFFAGLSSARTAGLESGALAVKLAQAETQSEESSPVPAGDPTDSELVGPPAPENAPPENPANPDTPQQPAATDPAPRAAQVEPIVPPIKRALPKQAAVPPAQKIPAKAAVKAAAKPAQPAKVKSKSQKK